MSGGEPSSGVSVASTHGKLISTYLQRPQANAIPSIIVSTVIVALASTGGSVHAAEHQHDRHPDHGTAKLKLNQGVKWPTDAPLRQGMKALNVAFAERLVALHKGRLSADEFNALGTKIDAEFGIIVAQCKLEAKADAMLHVMLADLLGAAAVMQGKAPGRPVAAAHKAVNALNGYGRHFIRSGDR